MSFTEENTVENFLRDTLCGQQPKTQKSDFFEKVGLLSSRGSS